MQALIPLFVAAAAILIAGCSTASTARPKKTALEIRAMQTRTFETTDMKMVMKSVLNVLQDEGFIVRNANIDLGLITADKQAETSSESNVSGTTEALVLGLVELGVQVAIAFSENNSGSSNSPSSSRTSASTEERRWEKYRAVECSANISEFGSQTRVRVNFQVRAVDNKGDMVTVFQIEDPMFYQDFFAKVDKGIFIAKEKL